MTDSANAPGADQGMSSVQRTNLTAAKEARKRAELDAQLLANRIALLKQEEEKAWNKINETRKRANEIVQLRSANEAKFMAKEQFYKEKWDSIRKAQSDNSVQRDQAKQMRAQSRDLMLQDKKNGVHAAKLQSQDNIVAKKEREATEKQANLDRGNHIKMQKLEAKRRMELERKLKLEQFHEEYEGRIGEEEMLRERTQALVAQMEKEEMELIQKLQVTQTVQRSAYEELESALSQTSMQISKSERGTSNAKKQEAPILAA